VRKSWSKASAGRVSVQVGDTAEDLATPARAELGPAGEGLTCRGHGSIDLGGLAAGDLPEHGAVDGGEVIEGVG
jgi:hypothetical protein